MVPSITIFVRHAPGCKYREDETWKRCNCRKHLRWSHDSKQYRRSANTRSGSKRNAKGGSWKRGLRQAGSLRLSHMTARPLPALWNCFCSKRKPRASKAGS